MYLRITNECAHYAEYFLSVCTLFQCIYTTYCVFWFQTLYHKPYCPMQATATCIYVTQSMLLVSNMDALHSFFFLNEGIFYVNNCTQAFWIYIYIYKHIYVHVSLENVSYKMHLLEFWMWLSLPATMGLQPIVITNK